MINPLLYIEVTLYFEIKDSSVYGGKGSIGYCSIKIGDVKKVDKMNDDHINYFIKQAASMTEVPPENVRLISKVEYDKNTEDEESDDW